MTDRGLRESVIEYIRVGHAAETGMSEPGSMPKTPTLIC